MLRLVIAVFAFIGIALIGIGIAFGFGESSYPDFIGVFSSCVELIYAALSGVTTVIASFTYDFSACHSSIEYSRDLSCLNQLAITALSVPTAD